MSLSSARASTGKPLHLAWIKALALVLASQMLANPVVALDLSDDVRHKLQRGETVDLIVEYISDDLDRTAKARPRLRNDSESSATTAMRTRGYRDLKRNVDQRPPSPAGVVRDFSHLPLEVRRFRSLTDVSSWVGDSRIRAVYEDTLLRPVLASSLPLIQQPATSAASYAGSGATVAVIDTGVNIPNAAFGGCTAVGTPASCRIVANQLVGSATGIEDNSHGTNVSAIVAGVAPGARIAMLNPFSGTSAYTSDVIAGINWAIANATTYNIVAINMSLGDSGNYSSTCYSAFTTPVANAWNAGITVVAASGNNAYTSGISSPACAAKVISVGAVYSRHFSALTWGIGCTDSDPDADEVTCFSNSSSQLSMLAPGALVTAGSIQQGGTSQASPHVAGAVAVLRAAFPAESLTSIRNRLLNNGVMVTDSRNGLSKPRLNLAAAARPANDDFSNRTLLSGTSGSVSAHNRLATSEISEPAPVSGTPGHTLWWRWVAPASGQVSLTTAGSQLDTRLAVYSNASVIANLVPLTSNDNDGSLTSSALLFQATAGQEYVFQVDGKNGAEGSVAINWNLNTNANANLSTTITGDNGTYLVTLSNAGPQTATNVVASITLPANATLLSASTSCTGSTTLSCPLGNLAAGSSISFTLSLGWSGNEAGTVTIAANSDLTDSTPSNNSGSIVRTITADADVPTLPEWVTLIFATFLLGRAVVQKRQKP